MPLWALFCDLMDDPESWSAGVRPQYAASLLSLRKERGVDRGGEYRGTLGAYPQDGEQAAVGLIVLEQASQLGEELRPLGAGREDLPGKAACQHVLCIGMEGRGGEERGTASRMRPLPVQVRRVSRTACSSASCLPLRALSPLRIRPSPRAAMRSRGPLRLGLKKHRMEPVAGRRASWHMRAVRTAARRRC